MARTGSTGYKSWKRQIQIHFGKNFSPLLSLSDSHSVSLISFSSPENDGTAAHGGATVFSGETHRKTPENQNFLP
jgi:hypothetical protein